MENNEKQHVAVGMYKKGGHYYIVKINYDPKTNTVGELQTVSEGDIKDVAMERFRILTAKEIF